MKKLLFFLLLTSCGPSYHGLGWPSELDAYVQHFINMNAGSSVQLTPIEALTIQFNDIQDSATLGFCEYMDNDRRIVLRRSFWSGADVPARETLIFHELGHCLAGEQHRGVILPDGRATSIMYPYLLSEHFYIKYTDYYQKELFFTVPMITTD